jgi:hypothetical protein
MKIPMRGYENSLTYRHYCSLSRKFRDIQFNIQSNGQRAKLKTLLVSKYWFYQDRFMSMSFQVKGFIAFVEAHLLSSGGSAEARHASGDAKCPRRTASKTTYHHEHLPLGYLPFPRIDPLPVRYTLIAQTLDSRVNARYGSTNDAT